MQTCRNVVSPAHLTVSMISLRLQRTYFISESSQLFSLLIQYVPNCCSAGCFLLCQHFDFLLEVCPVGLRYFLSKTGECHQFSLQLWIREDHVAMYFSSWQHTSQKQTLTYFASFKHGNLLKIAETVGSSSRIHLRLNLNVFFISLRRRFLVGISHISAT